MIIEAESGSRGLVFFGGYDPEYPRNAIIRDGCKRLGIALDECRAGAARKSPARYPLLASAYARGSFMPGRPIFVPDFRHKDVPLAWLLARSSGRALVFDPLVSRYETRVLDRGDAAPGSAQAAHNRNIDRISMRLADLVLADTESHARFFREEFGLSPGRVRTLRLGFEDSLFPPLPPKRRGKRFEVLFYGSFLPLHGVDTIIGAASMLSGRGFRFTLVGGGQTMEVAKKLARDLANDELSMQGPVPAARLSALMRESDSVLGIFGITRKTDMVIPNKVYQAMASGRPVVTADTSAVREIFESGKHLLAVPPGRPEALARALLRLREDEDMAASIAGRGRELVRSRFDPPGVASRLREIFEEKGIW